MKPLNATLQSSHFVMISKLSLAFLGLGLVATAYSQWASFVVTTIEWQKTLHTMLASHIDAVAEDALKYGGALIALSFFYGIFHAVGPGHGKAVILTYLGTHKESMRKGVLISLSAAILQSLIAITLVSVLARVLKLKLAEVHNYGNDVTLVSYVLVILLGVMLLITSVRRLFNLRRSRKEAGDHEDSHHHSAHEHSRSHNTGCGCTHAHSPDENQSSWQTVAVILSMGFRPCSGAIVVLIYAHLVGVYSYGVIATLMMGIGTGLSVCLIAVATLYARSWLARFARDSYEINAYSLLSVSNYIRIIGGTVLVTLGWSFYNAATVSTSGHPLF